MPSKARRPPKTGKPNKRKPRPRQFTLDPLEPRLLLSASPLSLGAAMAVHAAISAQDITTVTWTGGATGDWNTAANWSNQLIPGTNNDVVIPVGSTVTISAGNQAINSLECDGGLVISNGSLTLATDSTVGGSLTLEGTTITTNGTLTVSGTATSSNYSSVIAGSGTFVNNGSFDSESGLNIDAAFTNNNSFSITGGGMQISAGITFTNSTTGTVSMTGAMSIQGSGVFSNAGLFNSSSTGNNTLNAEFNNSGTLHVTAGTLIMSNAGTSTGTFNADSGTTFQFVSTTYTVSGASAAWNGAGLYQITSFGEVSFTSPASVTVQNLDVDTYSAVGGSGTLTIPNGGAFDWNGGSFSGAGAAIFDSGSTVNVTGYGTLSEFTVDNDTTLNVETGFGISFDTGGILNNESGATLALASDTTLGANGAGGTINNYGLITAADTSGDGVSIDAALDNYNTVHVTAGVLTLNNSGTSYAGTFNADTGTTIDFYAGAGGNNYTIEDNTLWSGPGMYEVTGFMGMTFADAATSVTVDNLTVNGFTSITLPGSITIAAGGSFNWNNGSITGGSINISNTATFTATDSSDYLNSGAITNDGTFTLDNTSLNLNLAADSTTAAVINNESDGTMNFTVTANYSGFITTGSNGGALNNYGKINSNMEGNYFNIEVPFTTSGTVESEVGQLGITAGGSSTGTWQADTGAVIGILAGYTFNSGTSWTGAGQFSINTGYYTSPVIIAAGVNLTASNVEFTGNGLFEVDGTLTIPSGGVFDFYINSFGIITGQGSITINSNAALNIGATQADETTVEYATINNYGTADMLAQSMAMYNGATFNNYGTFTVETGSGLTFGTTAIGGDGSTFTNSGTFTSNNPGVLLDITSQFNNTGSFTLTTGSAEFLYEGDSPSISDGSYSVTEGNSIEFGSNLTFNPGVELNGAGLYNVTETLTLNDPSINLAPSNFELQGTLDGTGSLTITPADSFNWNYGTIACTGGVTIQHGATVDVIDVALSNTTLTNDGVIDCDPGAGVGGINLQGTAVLNNESDGQINLQFADIVGYGGISDNGEGTLNNAGSILYTVNNSYTTDLYVTTFSNSGTLELDGGELYVEAPTQLTGGVLTGGTFITRDGGNMEMDYYSVFSNAATIVVDGAGSTDSFLPQLSGNSGSISILNGATVTMGADGSGNGGGQGGASVVADADTSGTFPNTGTIEIGEASSVTLTGDFSQSSSGTLEIHIGGTAASGLFGQLDIGGTANLGGTLQVVLDNYTPAIGDAYPILTYAARNDDFSTFQNVQPTFAPTAGTSSYVITGQNTNVPDLSAGNVTAPLSVVSGQPITVNYTVTDNGELAATGNWTDSIYLSPGAVFNASTAVLVGQVGNTNMNVGIGDYYQGTLTANAPGVTPGNYYVIVITDSKGQVSDSNRTNNSASSASTVAVTAPPLTLGNTLSGTVANGQGELYEIYLDSGAQVQLTLGTAQTAGASVYVSYGSAPTLSTFDETASNVNGDTASLLINANQPGYYYVMVYGQASSGSGAGFTLLANETAFGITSFTPTSGAGTTTITLTGSQFAAGDTVSLIPTASGATLVPTAFYYTNSNTIAATFNLAGIALGTQYDLQVGNGSITVTAPNAFTVGQSTSGAANPVLITITAPEDVRTGENYTIQVNYSNPTDQDIDAPLITLTATNALLRLADSSVFASGTIAFLGVNTGGGPAGILTPGYQGSITVQVEQSVVQNHTVFTYSYVVADPTDAMDYAALQPYLESSAYSGTDWTNLWADLQSRLGATQAGYLNALSQDASLLPASMGDSYNVIEVMQLEVNKSFADVTNSISGQISTTSAGLQLGGLSLFATDTTTGLTYVTTVLNNGTFQLGGLPADQYTLSLGGAVLGSSPAISVADGQHNIPVSLTATPGATLAGTTASATTGNILAGVVITATASDGTQYYTTSNA
ncbi:MAG TPA: CARDB domain-containing protein, partial [Chthoniobacteraceae bacterium]|nr:CARDB domain-containing protein [Chthoniobacteraceae bacterium]